MKNNFFPQNPIFPFIFPADEECSISQKNLLVYWFDTNSLFFSQPELLEEPAFVIFFGITDEKRIRTAEPSFQQLMETTWPYALELFLKTKTTENT